MVLEGLLKYASNVDINFAYGICTRGKSMQVSVKKL